MKEAMNVIDLLEKALLAMDRVKVEDIMREAIRDSSGLAMMDKLIVATFERLGRGWQDGHIALAQLYMSAMICEEVMDIILPPEAVKRRKQPKIGIAVLADHHALGKRLVSSILRTSGYELIDYGHGISVDSLVAKTIADRLDILLICTLMLPSALKVKEVLAGLRECGAKTTVIAGGAPFRLDPEMAKAVGVETVNNASDLPALIERMVL